MTWDTVDPLWAILAYPDRLGNRWSAEEFFATGEDQVGEYFAALEELDLAPRRRERALDFGCGAGRLTQALAHRFDRVDGVDVATSMVDLARHYNADPERVFFHLNERADLGAFAEGSYDFILSIVVFQHMSNDLKTGYLREFVRVLAPGGVALFTVPSHADLSPVGVLRRLPNSVRTSTGGAATATTPSWSFTPTGGARWNETSRRRAGACSPCSPMTPQVPPSCRTCTS